MKGVSDLKYIPTIGIEVHCELKTEKKAFSNSPNTYGLVANSVVNEIDMGYPGALPKLNKEIIDMGIKCAKVLNCKINKRTSFDRKNYFYPDNSKNFQITQKRYPIGYDGFIEIELNDTKKKIGIEEMHLEEDTAKSFHEPGKTLLDFNRAGIPLIEIVTKPDISNEIEAVLFVEKLREILSYIGISDVKIEEGSLRCDVNVSIRKESDEKLGTKVEIKGVGSINSIKQAILVEVERQKKLIDNNEIIEERTRRYDEKNNNTVLMRLKDTKNDYRYFPEPDIPPILISDEWIDSIVVPVLPDEIRNRYREYGINEVNISALILYRDLNIFLDKTIEIGGDPLICANLLTGDILSFLNKQNITIDDSKISIDDLKLLSDKILSNEISSKIAKVIVPILMDTGENIEEIIKSNNLVKIDNTEELKSIIKQLISDNSSFVEENTNNPDKIEKFLMGQVMKETKGNADPIVTKNIILEELNK